MPIKELELDLLPQLKKKELRAKRRVLSRILEGSWSSLLKGRGMEFAGFRQYTYGDDASRIDWGATLRAKEVLVREYEEYKTVNVFFLLDVSDSMLFTSTEKLKCEFAAELLFNLATTLIDSGNNVGYALFTDHILAKQNPSTSRDIIYHLAQDLMNGMNYGGKSDFRQVMRLVKGIFQQRSLIILISDFVEMPPGWERYVKIFSMEYDLLGLMIRDPRDAVLPREGIQVVVHEPGAYQEKLLIDAKEYATRYEEEARREEEYVKSIFEKARAGFLAISTTKDPFDLVTKYFIKRSKIVRG